MWPLDSVMESARRRFLVISPYFQLHKQAIFTLAFGLILRFFLKMHLHVSQAAF